MQYAPGQEQSEAGTAAMSGQAAAALQQYYSHEAMQVCVCSSSERPPVKDPCWRLNSWAAIVKLRSS